MRCMKVSTLLMETLSRSLLLNVPSNSFSPAVIPKEWQGWFHGAAKTISFMQDTVHLAVKLKSRLLKPRIVMSMGDYTVTGDHLYALKTGFQKDLHGLRLKDINHKDRQNFQAVLNIASAGHLLTKIPKANGTKCYVELIKFVIDSYLDYDLDPLSRIENLWYVVFFVRYWHKWILLNHRYTLRDNFITPNAYMCIELNAHALITFLLTIRDHVKNDSCLLLWLLGSQCCEMTFRIARSMSSTFSTVINFGMLGLLRRLHRLNIQLALQAESSEDIIFPRVIKHQQKTEKKYSQSVSLSEVTNDEIFNAVCKAQSRAKLKIEDLGMAGLFKKHSMWGSDIKIFGIDGGAENESAFDSDDNDSDEEDDENEANIEPTESQSIKAFIVQEACTDDATQIADDLKVIFKYDLVDSTIKETLEQQQQFLYRRLPSSTIPMYKQVDECVKAENATVKSQEK